MLQSLVTNWWSTVKRMWHHSYRGFLPASSGQVIASLGLTWNSTVTNSGWTQISQQQRFKCKIPPIKKKWREGRKEGKKTPCTPASCSLYWCNPSNCGAALCRCNINLKYITVKGRVWHFWKTRFFFVVVVASLKRIRWEITFREEVLHPDYTVIQVITLNCLVFSLSVPVINRGEVGDNPSVLEVSMLAYRALERVWWHIHSKKRYLSMSYFLCTLKKGTFTCATDHIMPNWGWILKSL